MKPQRRQRVEDDEFRPDGSTILNGDDFSSPLQSSSTVDEFIVALQQIVDNNDSCDRSEENVSIILNSKIQLIFSNCRIAIAKFRVLRSLTLTRVDQCEQLSALKTLPSLSELKLIDCDNFDAAFFKALGDLENNRNFTSLDISASWSAGWNSEGFQKDFCGTLLSTNRLTKLQMSSNCWYSTSEDDEEAFVNAGLSNVEKLGNCFAAKLIRGLGFRNLRILFVVAVSDEELVNIGNHCLFLEVLEAGGTMTGSFLNDENLVEDAFKHILVLDLDPVHLSTFDISRLISLEKLSVKETVSFDCDTCLQQLPNPDRLRTLTIENCKISICILLRFVNLEEIDISYFQVSHDDILSFAQFKQLKRLSLNNCGGATAEGEPFRLLCPHLENLEELTMWGHEPTRWTEEGVEAILTQCKRLRTLRCAFTGSGRTMSQLFEKKYPWVFMTGILQNKEIVEQESGSRREREE